MKRLFSLKILFIVLFSIIIIMATIPAKTQAGRDYISIATNTKVTLNASTFTKIADANSRRSYFMVCNATDTKIFINLRPVDGAVDETGIYLKSGGCWIMPVSTIYTGVICAIALAGTPSISIVEY